MSVKTFSSNYKVLGEALRPGSACHLFRLEDHEVYPGHRSYTILPSYNRYFFSNLHAPMSRAILALKATKTDPGPKSLQLKGVPADPEQHEMMGKNPLPSGPKRPFACVLPLYCGHPIFGLPTKHHTWPMPSSVTRAIKPFLKGSRVPPLSKSTSLLGPG